MTATPTTSPRAAAVVTTVALAVDMYLYGSLVPLLPVLPAVAGSPVLAGLLFTCYAVGLVVATPPIGHWVDRSGPRAPMLAGLIGLAAATIAFALSVGLSGPVGVLVLVLARTAQGVAAAASWTAGLALIALTHPPQQRGTVMGFALSGVGIGILLGPVVSGVLADAFGLVAPFLLVVVLAIVDAVARILWIRPTQGSAGSVPMRTVARGPSGTLLILLTALGAAALTYIEPVLPLHLSGLGFGASGIGLAFGAAALGGIVAAPLAGAVAGRRPPRAVAAAGAVATAVGLALCATASGPLVIAGVVLVGVGVEVVFAPTLVLIGALAEHLDPPAYGSAYALYNLAYTGGMAVAPALAGGLAAAGGVPVSMLCAAAVVVLAGLALVVRR